jgi:hypothetical protein|tara:strand:- start:435 stop:1343 length:909 start_codon:yes stop_codon:yes gene_type:complete
MKLTRKYLKKIILEETKSVLASKVIVKESQEVMLALRELSSKAARDIGEKIAANMRRFEREVYDNNKDFQTPFGERAIAKFTRLIAFDGDTYSSPLIGLSLRMRRAKRVPSMNDIIKLWYRGVGSGIIKTAERLDDQHDELDIFDGMTGTPEKMYLSKYVFNMFEKHFKEQAAAVLASMIKKQPEQEQEPQGGMSMPEDGDEDELAGIDLDNLIKRQNLIFKKYGRRMRGLNTPKLLNNALSDWGAPKDLDYVDYETIKAIFKWQKDPSSGYSGAPDGLFGGGSYRAWKKTQRQAKQSGTGV